MPLPHIQDALNTRFSLEDLTFRGQQSNAYGWVVNTRMRTVDVSLYGGGLAYGCTPSTTVQPLNVGDPVIIHRQSDGSYIAQAAPFPRALFGDHSVGTIVRATVTRAWSNDPNILPGENTKMVEFKHLGFVGGGTAYVADYIERLRRGDHVLVMRESGQQVPHDSLDVSETQLYFTVIARLPSVSDLTDLDSAETAIDGRSVVPDTHTTGGRTESKSPAPPPFDPLVIGTGVTEGIGVLDIEIATVTIGGGVPVRIAPATQVNMPPITPAFSRDKLAYRSRITWQGSTPGNFEAIQVCFLKRTNNFGVTATGATLEIHQGSSGPENRPTDATLTREYIYLAYGGGVTSGIPGIGTNDLLSDQEGAVFQVTDNQQNIGSAIWITFDITNPPG